MTAAVILGNRMSDDGALSEIMTRRLKLANELYQKYNPDYIILSGGIANKKAGISEASAMYAYLKDAGIPEKLLLREERSLTTAENAKYSVAMAREKGADTLLVCTTSEHFMRPWLNPQLLFLRAMRGTGMRLLTYTKAK